MRVGEGRLKRHRDEMGEDVNPSAYIVNLADCMLVLACGFMVAMMAKWNINMPVEEVDSSSMEEVAPSVAPEDLSAAGSGYVEAGKVYIDPETGTYYIIKKNETDEAADADGGGTEGDGSETTGDGSGATGGDGSGTEGAGATGEGATGAGSGSGSGSSGTSAGAGASGGTSSGGGSSTAGMFGM